MAPWHNWQLSRRSPFKSIAHSFNRRRIEIYNNGSNNRYPWKKRSTAEVKVPSSLYVIISKPSQNLAWESFEESRSRYPFYIIIKGVWFHINDVKFSGKNSKNFNSCPYKNYTWRSKYLWVWSHFENVHGVSQTYTSNITTVCS